MFTVVVERVVGLVAIELSTSDVVSAEEDSYSIKMSLLVTTPSVVVVAVAVAVVCDLKLEQQNKFSLNTEAETTTGVKQF